jgi:hypothetical protein
MKRTKEKKVLLMFVFFVSCIFTGSVMAGLPKFSIRLTGGGEYLLIGDTNKDIEGLVNFWKDVARVQDGTVTDEFKPFHFGLEGELEVVIHLRSNLGINIGFGYINAQKKSNQMNSHFPERQLFRKVDNIIDSKPIKVGLSYSLPLFTRGKIVLSAGGGYYLTTWSETGHYSEEKGASFYAIDWNLDANANGIGFHGSVGLEYEISNRFSIVIEGYGRFCKIEGFKGDGNVMRSNGTSSVVSDVPLYYSEWRDFITTGEWYPDINLVENAPSGEHIRNARDALIDLSGFVFRIGLKINL